MAIPSKLTLYKLNDQYIQIEGLVDGLNSASFFNAATVTATLKDRSGNIVTGVNAVTLSYVAATNGNYRGAIQETFDPTAGGGYTLYIDAVQSGVVGHWEIKTEVKVRNS